jgi:hypothetical protein
LVFVVGLKNHFPKTGAQYKAFKSLVMLSVVPPPKAAVSD